MAISARTSGGIGVIHVTGHMMDVPESTRLHKKVKTLIEKDVPWIVVNLGKVAWLNSKGVGALVSGMTSCRNAGGDLVVAGATKKVKSILSVTQIIRLIDSYENVGEAKEALKVKMAGAGG